MCRLPSAAQSAVDGKRRDFFRDCIQERPSGKKDPARIIDPKLNYL